jgi:UDPglucose 6-dehydrogenase
MNVAVVGCGFVGNALINGLCNKVNLLKIDPKYGSSIKDLKSFKAEIIFICVPTPMSSEGDQDLSALDKTIDYLSKLDSSYLVVIKSTVLPNYIERYKERINNLVYNPEFLTERNADNDFINSNLILFGGDKNPSLELGKFYDEYTKCITKEYVSTDLVTSSLIKYSINSFLATKVIFFNELYNLYKKSNSQDTWSNITKILSRDSRIGNSHLDVPGPDGRFGFGGACFPKDTQALVMYAKNIGIELNIIKTAIGVNNSIRSEYNSPTSRESSQNVSFKGEV